jgi:hypothetical protein
MRKAVNGTKPRPGEKWKVQKLDHSNESVTLLDPLQLIKVIENYKSITGERLNKNPNTLPFHGNPNARIVGGHPNDRVTGSMNRLLRGNKH